MNGPTCSVAGYDTRVQPAAIELSPAAFGGKRLAEGVGLQSRRIVRQHEHGNRPRPRVLCDGRLPVPRCSRKSQGRRGLGLDQNPAPVDASHRSLLLWKQGEHWGAVQLPCRTERAGGQTVLADWSRTTWRAGSRSTPCSASARRYARGTSRDVQGRATAVIVREL